MSAIIDTDAFWMSYDDVPELAGLGRAMADFHRVHEVPRRARLVRDAVYGTGGGRPLKAILFARKDPSECRPAVVFVHGGSFLGGSPFIHLRQAAELAAAGYVTAAVSYRVLPEAGTILGCLEDTKCAIRWIRANASAFGADPERIAIAGGSAGGHLSAMVALTPGRFEGAGGHTDVSSAVRAAVLWYPVTHMHEPWMTDAATRAGTDAVSCFLGGDGSLAARLFPPAHAHREAPPILTMTGSNDVWTPVHLVRAFHCALDAAGAPNRLEVLDGREHVYDFAPHEWPASYARMKQFLDETL